MQPALIDWARKQIKSRGTHDVRRNEIHRIRDGRDNERILLYIPRNELFRKKKYKYYSAIRIRNFLMLMKAVRARIAYRTEKKIYRRNRAFSRM